MRDRQKDVDEGRDQLRPKDQARRAFIPVLMAIQPQALVEIRERGMGLESPMKKVPEVGESIFVPSIAAEPKMNGRGAWDLMKKKGGIAIVGRVQQVSENQHYICVTEWGAYDMSWEEFLEPQQDKLAEQPGDNIRAQTD